MKAETIFKILFYIAVIGLILIAFMNIRAKQVQNYYRNQMINFCMMTYYDNKDSYPELYPCEKWDLRSPLFKENLKEIGG